MELLKETESLNEQIAELEDRELAAFLHSWLLGARWRLEARFPELKERFQASPIDNV